MSPEAFLLLALAVLIGALVQGTIGVGFALIVAPVAAFLRPDLVPVVVLALMAPLNAFVLWRERHSVDWRGGSWVLLGRLAGTGGGLAILLLTTPRLLDVFVGASTLLAAATSLWLPTFAPGRNAFLGAGFVTGVTETATGIGGPPLALVYQHHPGPVIRATIAACFLAGQIVSIGLLIALGRVARTQIDAAALLCAPLLLGVWASQFTHLHADAAWLRRAILIFACASGALLLARSAF